MISYLYNIFLSLCLSTFLSAYILRQLSEISKTLIVISGRTKNWVIFFYFMYIFLTLLEFLLQACVIFINMIER